MIFCSNLARDHRFTLSSGPLKKKFGDSCFKESFLSQVFRIIPRHNLFKILDIFKSFGYQQLQYFVINFIKQDFLNNYVKKKKIEH